MVDSLLVVCSGNICRSPMGERLLQQLCPTLRVESAGTIGLTGHHACHHAQHITETRGLSLKDHCARKLTAEMAQSFDLLLVMEPLHIHEITELAPWVRGKTMLFGHWSQRRAIPDPWRHSQPFYDAVFSLLEKDAQQWARRLNA